MKKNLQTQEGSVEVVSGTFFPAEAVYTELKDIRAILQTMTANRNEGGNMVWASQATLAKRYDMSKSTICRILAHAVATEKVRKLNPPNGGVLKYNVAEVDAYMFGSNTPEEASR